MFRARVFRSGGRLLGLWSCVFVLAASASAVSFTNPIMSSGADPWIAYQNGYYYLTYTSGSNVRLRQGRKLTGPAGVAEAKAKTVFTPAAPYNKNVWAPELHFIQGRAYLYFAADDGDNANHRMYVAQGHANGTPTSFTSKGKIFDPTTDRWAIDGTVLQADDGALYFIWSGWPGAVDGRQNLYIAPMSNPWTISGPRVLLSTPTEPWESWIQEGPVILKRNGMVFLVYAANKSWTDNECIGLLVNTDGNYLNPASWTKQPQPIFSTYVGPDGAVYGPGHCSFTQSLDGTEDWIFYHAAKSSGAGWDRNVRMQRISWAANGYPVLGRPVPAGILLDGPSGDDFTLPRITEVAPQTGRKIRIRGQAPLPLQTNRWTIEYSGNLSRWHTLSNVSGLQFAAEVVESLTSSNRFYRIRFAR
ncbi:MAG TPA: glycoside hydrolase family 43 protein [Verrucomicrobiota bacterium]|jgi:GH43 family beta-xylosidase|nr:glycoside hydrolase family 43 protein [Verrucomicrobiota bacterium]HQB17702.1 glycoside hydrolase family 43 protein [Verrucomicrobiota bacterium]